MQNTETDAFALLELVEWLAPQYLYVRILPDGSIACIQRLMFTWGIFLGVNRDGWGARFCFDKFELAFDRFGELEGEDDEPAGYIARR